MPITTTGSIVYFKDDLGLPLIGGKVYTYEYSTSKPKDIYKTAVRELPHTNPVILNDSGSVEWYLKGDYTIRVYTSEDVFVEEFDIVTPSKVQVDEVSDSLNLLKSELKNAAYCDTGTAAAQVPLNSDLGTAAYKDAGTAAGNVMQVGAFGLGEGARVVTTNTSIGDHVNKLTNKTEFVYSLTDGSDGEKAFGDYAMGLAINAQGDTIVLGLDMLGTKSGYMTKSGNGSVLSTTFWTTGNAAKDPNGFLRDSNSTSEVVIKDAAGVATANGIQAGVGAPKIAYKKFVLPSGTPTVAHGLNRNKILNISGVYVNGVERYPYAGAKVNATILDATQNSTSERHILITYEV